MLSFPGYRRDLVTSAHLTHHDRRSICHKSGAFIGLPGWVGSADFKTATVVVFNDTKDRTAYDIIIRSIWRDWIRRLG